MARWLVATAALYVVLLTSIGVLRRLTAPQPANPWEAGQIVEAWRSVTGQPVYEAAATGHATHMYGALAPVALGAIFKVTGPSNMAARVFTLVSALLLFLLILGVSAGPYNAFHLLIGASLLLGTDSYTGGYIAQARPDLTALFLACLALAALYRGATRERWLFSIAGAVLLLVAFFFKQTAAMAALVPIAVLGVSKRDRQVPGEIARAVIPLVSVIVAVLAMRVLRPDVFHYMIQVPGEYRISASELLSALARILIAAPLFWVVLVRRRGDERVGGVLENWLWAALLVTIPLSALTSAKAGGTYNSWWPALLAMHAYTIFLLVRQPLRTTFEYLVLGALLFASAPTVHTNVGYMPRHADYGNARAEVARLRGTIVSPENPAVLLPAHAPGRNLYLEFDAAPSRGGWHRQPPCYAWHEILAADYVVDIQPWWGEMIDGERLVAAGYVRTFRSVHYAILRRPHRVSPALANDCWNPDR